MPYTTTSAITNTIVLTDQNKSYTIAPTVLSLPKSPVANFTASATKVAVNKVITFTNSSTGAPTPTYLWDFGDGGTSTLANPTRTYTETGTFTVTLTATNAYGANEKKMAISVGNPPVAGFNVNKTTVMVNEAITFTNTSTGDATLTFLWNFGDTKTSTATIPVHSYSAAGIFTVTLRATNDYGVSNATPLAIIVNVYKVFLPVILR